MNAYVDASVVLAIVLDEPGAIALEGVNPERAWTSELTEIECARMLDRLRLTAAYSPEQFELALADLESALSRFDLVRLNPLVLRVAARPFPSVLRTLDALHVACAITLREQLPDPAMLFLTHDRQQARAARELGFDVRGVAREAT